MNETVDALKFKIGSLQLQIFETIAENCQDAGDVLIFADDLDSGNVRKLADLVAEHCGGTAAVLSGTDADGYSYCLVTRNGDLRSFVKDMNAALNGRGGGKPQFQQGSLHASKEAVKSFFKGFTCR